MSYAVNPMASASGASAMSGASAAMPYSQKMSNLFNSMDTSGSGSITQSQLQSAFSTQNVPRNFQQLGANALWSQLDPSNTGSVSKQQFVQGMTSTASYLRNSGSASASSASASSNATISASLQALNPNGSLYLSA